LKKLSDWLAKMFLSTDLEQCLVRQQLYAGTIKPPM